MEDINQDRNSVGKQPEIEQLQDQGYLKLKQLGKKQ